MVTQRDRARHLARQTVAHAAAAHVSGAFWANARRAAGGGKVPRGPAPKGMGGTGLFVRDQSGQQTIDPVTLNRIPAGRALRVGKQYWNSTTIRKLLERDSQATNPLTRQPFPADVYAKYAPKLDDIRDVTNVARSFLQNGWQKKMKKRVGTYILQGTLDDDGDKMVELCWKSCRGQVGEMATIFMNAGYMVVAFDVGGGSRDWERVQFIQRQKALFLRNASSGGYAVVSQ